MDNQYKGLVDYLEPLTNLDNFKSNPIFQITLEHISSDQGKEYLYQILTKTSLNTVDIINYCNKNDKYGNSEKYNFGFITTSPTNLRYIFHAHLILKHINSIGLNNVNIVEVGCGYGGLCLAIDHFKNKYNVTINSYNLVDLPAVSKLQKMYLSEYNLDFNVDFYSALEYGSTIPYTDMFLISNYAFSEISEDNQEKYVKILFPKVKNGFMVWNTSLFYDFGLPYKDEMEYPLTGPVNKYLYF